MLVRSDEQAVDHATFAEQLASALNYSVGATDILVHVEPLPEICRSESSVRSTFKLTLASTLALTCVLTPDTQS